MSNEKEMTCCQFLAFFFYWPLPLFMPTCLAIDHRFMCCEYRIHKQKVRQIMITIMIFQERKETEREETKQKKMADAPRNVAAWQEALFSPSFRTAACPRNWEGWLHLNYADGRSEPSVCHAPLSRTRDFMWAACAIMAAHNGQYHTRFSALRVHSAQVKQDKRAKCQITMAGRRKTVYACSSAQLALHLACFPGISS